METPKFTKGKVRRRCLHEWLPEVDGLVCGPFGLLKGEYSLRYELTHMPSGYLLRSYRSQRAAKEAVARLLALPIGWSFRSAKNLKKAVKQQIQLACLF